MRGLGEIQTLLRRKQKDLWQEFGVIEIGIFGSYVRNEATAESDIDILVSFDRQIGFFEFLRLEEMLSSLLGVKVDLVTRAALKPRMGKRILDEVAIL